MDPHAARNLLSDFILPSLLAANPQASTLLVVLLVILLSLAFLIAGAEVALFSLNRKDINMLKTKQQAGARRIVELLETPKEVYATLLISGTVVNISIIVLANHLLNTFISFTAVDHWVEVLTKVLLIAVVLVFAGQLLPRVWATQNVLRFAYSSSTVVETLHLVLGRFSARLVALADGIGKRAGANRRESRDMQELDAAIDIKSDEEASPEEKNILRGIVKFGNITVRQIMRSRLEVSGIPYELPLSELVRRVEELHYSRLPVYRGSLDQVAGILNTKDLLPHVHEEQAGFDWHSLMRQPYFVPETKLIEDLLREFQQKRIHFAVVVDEFGGTSGIVTMEDILEEVIGDIRDEFDEEETGNRQLDENNFVLEGRTMIHDMCKLMRLPMDTFETVKGESESVGGLVLELAGEIPVVNTVVEARGLPRVAVDFDFTVLQADHHRIHQVKVTKKSRTL